MKIRVVDLETTGRSEDRKAGKEVTVCEVGWTDIDEAGNVSKPQAALVNPQLPIPPEARGIHHISDEMVQGAVNATEGFMILMAGMEPGDLFAAHHAEFERAFFGGGLHPWICTLITAKHLWPDAPDHKNQTLRYWLDLESEIEWPELAMPPHRAGPDSYVTALILARRMMLMKSPASLVELTRTPVLQKKVMFGEKHRGELWADMDTGFLEWVIGKDFDAETKHTARYWLQQKRRSTNPFQA